jgi:hypothetical protein
MLPSCFGGNGAKDATEWQARDKGCIVPGVAQPHRPAAK